MELDKLCRLCGDYSKTTYNVFSKNDSGQQLIQLIKQCLPVLVYRTDPLSKEICQTCYTKLNDYSSFITTSIETHDNFNSKLVSRINESPVRLYLDSLENANQPEHHVGHYRSPRSVRHFASQIKIETRTNCTNTVPPKATSPERSPAVKNITILTPSKINELSEKSSTHSSASQQSEAELEQPRKKRRLIGPKSKLRLISARSKPAPPLSLLQCALTQVNRNLNVTFESHPDQLVSESSEISENSQSPLPAAAVENDEEYTHLSLLEPSIDIMEQSNVPATSCDTTNIDLNEPVTCNYCFKKFRNIVDLAHHEIRHIKVDIGPPVDTREFCVKQRKLAGYYQNWLSRQLMNDIEREHSQSTSNDGSQNEEQTAEQDEKSPEDENSLLVPTYASTTHVFSIKDNEIYVDGVLLRSMDKTVRRTLYKDIMINGIKRKFCPLCRHTFKDNWAIEGHYFSSSCQFTCKYCGRKFKYHKELFNEHLETHKGEPNNKIFGPKDRRYRFKKKKYMTHSHTRPMYSQILTVPPKVKPIKMKHLLQKKMNAAQPIKIKTEPDLPPMNEAVTLEASGSANQQPYQAYFCRKCFKVFFKVDQYNHHIRLCTGEQRTTGSSKTTDTKTQNNVKPAASVTPLKRPVRSCVKEISSLTDVDDDSQDDEYTIKKSSNKHHKTPKAGFECGVCCSSFPTIHSRNSHMRIHKGQQQQQQQQQQHQMPSQKTVLNKVAPKSHAIAKPEPQQPITAAAVAQVKSPDIRLANLNPTVARLVQNNPHLTIRSYSKSEVEKQAEQQEQIRASSSDNSNDNTPDHHIKRVYKCADCNGKFENKSVLYYHKMNSCVIKRHYECAFCRKKFGTYDQYNTHMFYVHPE